MEMVLNIILVISLTAFVKSASVGSSSSDFLKRAQNMLDSFENTFNTKAKNCAIQGKSKGNTFNGKDDAYKAEVALVNIYTQQCTRSTNTVFYAELNADTSREPYRTFATLLDEAISILSYDNGVSGGRVYRGKCGSKFPSVGQTYSPRRFTSTSTRVEPALNFLTSCFIIIENAVGVHVQSYSAFPGESEVLLTYNANYQVKSKTVGDRELIKDKIQNAVNDLENSVKKLMTVNVIVLDQLTALAPSFS